MTLKQIQDFLERKEHEKNKNDLEPAFAQGNSDFY